MFVPLGYLVTPSWHLTRRELFYSDINSMLTIKCSKVFVWSCCFCPILTKFWVCQHIFMQDSSIRFDGNPSGGNRKCTTYAVRRQFSRYTLPINGARHFKALLSRWQSTLRVLTTHGTQRSRLWSKCHGILKRGILQHAREFPLLYPSAEFFAFMGPCIVIYFYSKTT